MYIDIDIKKLHMPEDDPKHKVQSLLDTIIGVVRAHFPNNNIEFDVYPDTRVGGGYRVFVDAKNYSATLERRGGAKTRKMGRGI